MFATNAFRNRVVLLLMAPLLAMLALTFVLGPQALGAPSRQGVQPNAPGKLSGVVTNEDGTPLPGITVELFMYGGSAHYPNSQTTTDAKGAYTFPVLSAGIYYLRFEDPSGIFGAEFYDNAGRFEEATGIPVAGHDVTGIDVSLTAGGQISGVVSISGPDPFEGVPTEYGPFFDIALFEEEGKTEWRYVDEIRPSALPYTYTFDGLGATRYRICAYVYSGYVNDMECYDDASSMLTATPIDLNPAEIRTGVDIALGDGGDAGTFSGTVTDQDGAPLEGIKVSASSTEQYRYGLTDIDGTFTITDIAPSAYRIFYSDPQGKYVSSYYDPDNSGEPQQIELGRYGAVTGLDQTLAPAAWIMGAVTLRDGYPAMDGRVRAIPLFPWDDSTEPSRSVRVSSTGQYTITGQKAGPYHVVADVYHNGHNFFGSYSVDGTNPQTVTLAAGEIRTGIDIEVAEGAYDGILNGTVTTNGEPLPNIRVDISDDYYYGSRTSAASIVSPGASETEVDPPISAAEMLAIEGPIFYTMTNANGEYAVEGMLAGMTYRVHFSDPAGVYASLCNSDPQAPYYCSYHYLDPISNRLTISTELPLAGRITGRVSLPEGEDRNDYRIQSYFTKIYNYYDYYYGYNMDDAVRAEIDEDGTYTLPGLYGGVYRVALIKLIPYYDYSGYYYDYDIVQVYPRGDYLDLGQDIIVEPESTVPNINFFLNLTEHMYLPNISSP